MMVLFTDICGVYATLRAHIAEGVDNVFGMTEFDRTAVKLINRLLEVNELRKDPEEVRLVISSNWRILYPKDEIMDHFRDAGFTGKFHDDWCTPVIKTEGAIRGDEINAWRTVHPEVTKYAGVDDLDDGETFYPDQPIVITKSYEGLSLDNFFALSKILYGDENAWLKAKRAIAPPSYDFPMSLKRKLPDRAP